MAQSTNGNEIVEDEPEEPVNPPIDVCSSYENTEYGTICFTLADETMMVKFTKNEVYSRAELLLAYQSDSNHDEVTLLTRDYYAEEQLCGEVECLIEVEDVISIYGVWVAKVWQAVETRQFY